MRRVGSINPLHRAQDLFHQFSVDMAAKMERLGFIKLNQKRLRCDCYIHLQDGIRNEVNPRNLEKACILPSSFTGGPRYMHARTQDAMTYIRHYGRPYLFITFTCKPKWVEITSELLPEQRYCHRHDLIARVFRQKVIKLMDLITKGQIFGPVRCDMYTIEWQKRGLPYAHILIWLTNRIDPTTVDDIISAEIPDPVLYPQLYEIVKCNMVHGPCGPGFETFSACHKNNTCTKNFPKKFTDDTSTAGDGYPLYRRRQPENGCYTVNIKGHSVDNRWIVPY